MLALSEGDNLYRVRRSNEETGIEENLIYARWRPWHNVCVESWIVAGLPWHYRIHRISTDRELDVAEGGFALGLEPAAQGEQTGTLSEGGVLIGNSLGSSGVAGKLGYERAELIYPNANTNVLYPRTVIPTLRGRLRPGNHWLIAAIYGNPACPGAKKSARISPPESAHEPSGMVDVGQNEIRIKTFTGQVKVIRMD